MKQFSLSILLTLFISMAGINAFAYDIAVDNADGVTIYYNYYNEGKELEVTFLSSNYSTNASAYEDNVVIPEEVTYMSRTRKVTSIGAYAFHYCSSLTSVTIPNSVESIEKGAFRNSGLTSVTIPKSVTSIGHSAFENCSSLTSAIIENGVTSIGESAFWGSGLTSVTIPNSVKSIERNVFNGCFRLTSVYISDLVAWCNISFSDQYSSPLSFAHAGRLFLKGEVVNDLVIPNNVTSINSWAFRGCAGLTSVTIPNSVKYIGEGAFASCI